MKTIRNILLINMKFIKILLIGIIFAMGMSACSTIGPPPDGPDVVYYYENYGNFPKNYHYYDTYYPYYYRSYNYHYRPAPSPRPKQQIPPPQPNTGNKRHR